MIRVGIVGGTGYTGLELLRILESHPEVHLEWITSERYAGIALEEYCSAFRKRISLVLQKQELAEWAKEVEVVFLALPHGIAIDYVPFLLEKTRVIDLGADFRLQNVTLYEKHYHLEHRAKEFLGEAVYGIPEIYRSQIRGAHLVANPGCYPTSVIIPLYPLFREGIRLRSIIIDSKSGVSGAGKKATEEVHFCEVDENFKAYKVGEHRHQPEIEEQLRQWGEVEEVTFVPHLLPLKRGILSTIYLELVEDRNEIELWEIWQRYFAEEPWVRVMPLGKFPELKWVLGSNFIDMGLHKVGSKRVVIVSVIDNLTKGASGQAVQNMNVMFALPETLGLPKTVLYP
ncbi:MAG: N-acetyl-gamma-glutamyl-phosphate reductase [Candidatus Caldatribacteriaceae bacterium]